MRTIIAGSRKGCRYQDIENAVVASGWSPSVVLSGGAKGADYFGEIWAAQHGVPIEHFPADWQQYGKRAGYLRNERMAMHAEALIAIWDGESRGTSHMIDLAKENDLTVFIYRTDKETYHDNES